MHHLDAAFLLGKVHASGNNPNYEESDRWLTLAFDKRYHKVPYFVEELDQKQVFNETNYPRLYQKLVDNNMWLQNNQLSNWDGKPYERITVTGSTLNATFDTLLATFRGRNSSTGSRISGDCYKKAACQRKDLNDMKDSIWVSQ